MQHLARNRDLVKSRDLAEHYSKTSNQNLTQIQKIFKKRLRKFTSSEIQLDSQKNFQNYDSLSPFTSEGIVKDIQALKRNKSPGENGTKFRLLKWDGQSLARHLHKVINDCWTGAQPIPLSWIDAVVISIYKGKGSEIDPVNYHSNFPLDAIEKLYSSILCRRLK